jgi:hypothetical protein
MRSSLTRSWLSLAGWFYIGPFVVLGGLALLVFGFSAAAVVVQALAAFLRHVGV